MLADVFLSEKNMDYTCGYSHNDIAGVFWSAYQFFTYFFNHGYKVCI